jgi:amino acid adenylation domain-containing protein
MVGDASAGVDALPLLPAAERRQLLRAFNATEAPYPQDACIHELFEQQVAATPDAVAVVYENESLTYAELNVRANRLAHALIGLGVQPDDRVAICVERSLDMVIGLLGILKAGGAYVPLDPAQPDERLAWMLEDCAPVALLTQGAVSARLPFTGHTLTLDAETTRAFVATQSAHTPASSTRGLNAAHLAYVIYTSGSTGRPKGVMIEHRSVLNLWKALERLQFVETGAGARIGLNASISFDASVQSLLQLLSGHCVVVLPQSVRADAEAFLRYAQSQSLDAFDCTPAQLALLLQAGLADEAATYKPKAVLVGGESIGVPLWNSLKASRSTRFFNVYGPTECTVDATACAIDEEGDTPVIGRPLSNTTAYILDPSGQPVPVGVAGELHIGGAGVARGYLNRPELTADRFLRDPFSENPEARMYKTGDLGRWLPDGSIEYLGRNDFQVKIRGFRIELGEIEAKLVQCDGVREAVVVAREDGPGDKRLVAYLVAQEGTVLSVTDLREALSRHLPEYMFPSAFVPLESLPLTSNGKLDRKALPAPDALLLASREYEAPQGELEETLAVLWQNLLRAPRVGRHDNFFELGGHSLLVVQFIHRLQATTPYHVTVRDLFQHPSLSALAAHIVTPAQTDTAWSPLLPLTEGKELPVLYGVSGIGMTAASWQPVAEALRGQAAVRIFEPRGLDGTQPFCNSMAEIVEVNLQAMLADDPEGPYWLAGHSFGGSVAFEMALALQARGKSVHLCILDSLLSAPELEPRRSELPPAGRAADGPAILNRLRSLIVMQQSIYDRYVPSGVFSGKVTLLSAMNGAIAAMPMEVQMDAYHKYCAALPERRLLSGDHHSILLPPFAGETAAELLAAAGVASEEAIPV